jgi:predicted NBD/HSP70 family sugar kinase
VFLVESILSRTRTLSRVCREIRDGSPISRTTIAARAELTHAAVSRAVAELLTRKAAVEEKLIESAGPRRKRGLRLNGDYGYALGVCYTPSSMTGVALDLAGARRATLADGTSLASLPVPERVALITGFADQLVAEARRVPGTCLGVGLVDPGIVDSERGVTSGSSLMENWNDVPIAQAVHARCGLPVRLLGTGLARLKAVDRLELPRPARNLLYVEYGEGIACGLKLDGRYLRGTRDSAGELGHVKVSAQEPRPCRCGGLGCLEAHASLPALARRCQEALAAGSRSILSRSQPLDGIRVLQAAAQHDHLACSVVEEAFETLGTAIAGVVSITNPRDLVLDGTLASAGDEMRDVLLRSVRRNLLPDHWRALEVRFSTLDAYAAASGAAVDRIDALLEY